MAEDRKIIVSPLPCQFSEDGVTIDFPIYELEGGDGWILELVDKENSSIAWNDPFQTDRVAWEEFVSGVRRIGLTALLEPDDGDEGVTVL